MKLIMSGVLLAAACSVAPGARAASTEIPCTLEQDLAISPGLGLAPTSGTYRADSPARCTGSIGGHTITGVGTWHEEGHYGIAKPIGCADTEGDFDQQDLLTLPTDGGPVRIVTPLHGTFGPLREGGLLGGSFSGPNAHGTFTALPARGDCVTAPVTQASITAHFVLATD
jgi:hypothetical protein